MRSWVFITAFAAVSSTGMCGDPWDRVPPQAESLLEVRIPLQSSGGSTLTFGGHARTMFESYRNRDFGFAKVPEDDWVHHRLQISTLWEKDEHIRVFSELTWGEMQGMEGDMAPPDEDQVDLLQLYVHARPRLEDSNWTIRVGRQILFYGSGRLLAHREGANQRLVHDALRLGWQHEQWRVDALVASPVRIGPEEFDNASRSHQSLLWGVYATGSPLGKEHGMDLYYLGLRRDSSPLLRGQGETRHTFGTRLFGSSGPWSYNHEFILQTGEVEDREILAGAISLGGGYSFENVFLHPTVGFRGDLISGGQRSSRLSTFDPLFQANNYFNEGGFISPSNLYNLNPRISLQLTRALGLDLGVNFLWRFDPDDSVYAPPFTAVAGPAPNGARYLGTAYNIALAWEPHPSFAVSFGYTHHEAGPSLTAVGGRSVEYLQIAARVEF